MIARISSQIVAFTVVLALVGGGCERGPSAGRGAVRPRNLIVISIDTLRADHLGCYGYARATSPRIDAYARRGVRFSNCTSSSSWTAPAHLTLFTGLEPAAHGCVDYPAAGRINEEFETMAKALGRHGLSTAGFTGGGHVGLRHGVDIGFDWFNSVGQRFERNIPRAEKWVAGVRGKPFFLFLHGYNVHRPYVPPTPYDERFSRDYVGDYDVRAFRPGTPQPSAEDLEFVVSQYDGEIAYVDDLLGDFLDRLDAKGVLDRTLVIIMSDHGEEFYEHGHCDHTHTLYDELVRVPWIMFGPGIPAKTTVRDAVGLIDILPTVLDLFGIETEATLQGVSRAFADGWNQGSGDEAVFGFTGYAEFPYHLSSVRTDRWKLVVNRFAGMKDVDWTRYDPRPDYAYKITQRMDDFVELFDLRADPGERDNVAKDRPDVVARLAKRLEARIEQSNRLRREMTDPGPPDEAYIETLRSLGYLP